MSEIRDIKPAEPLWQKRPIEKAGRDANPDTPAREEKKRKRRPQGKQDDSRGNSIDEYA